MHEINAEKPQYGIPLIWVCMMKIKMEIFPQKNYPTKPFWGFPFGPSVPKAGSDYMGLVCTYTNLFHKAHTSEKLVCFFGQFEFDSL